MQHLLGFQCVGYVEWEGYCQRLIRQRQEDGFLDKAPIFGDIRAFVDSGYAASYTGLVDVVTGGFPCQDISCAGKGKGITGERSGLWSVMADTIRIIRPRFAFVENSPMLTVRGLGTVLGDLAEMGFDAEHGVFSAADVGARHIRERLWILAHTHDNKYIPVCAQNYGFSGTRENAPKWSTYRIFSDMGSSGSTIFGRQVHPELVARTVDDLAHRVDGIKASGNGQVPAVAALAWRILNE